MAKTTETPAAAEPAYPEHERLHAVVAESQAIGAFLDWLLNERGRTVSYFQPAGRTEGVPRYVWKAGVTVARRTGRPVADQPPTGVDEINGDAVENPEYDSWGDRWVPDRRSITAILAEYFGIDLDRLEAEKRAMLEVQRRLNQETP